MDLDLSETLFEFCKSVSNTLSLLIIECLSKFQWQARINTCMSAKVCFTNQKRLVGPCMLWTHNIVKTKLTTIGRANIHAVKETDRQTDRPTN